MLVQRKGVELIKKPQRLQKRNHKFYCRVSVPHSLRAVLGRTEVIKALGTGDYAEALRKLPRASARVDTMFAQARRKFGTSKKLKGVAYHEAGHAVAAWSLGCSIWKVTIVLDGSSAGKTIYGPWYRRTDSGWDGSPRVQRRLENMALMTLAGPAAERRFNPRSRYHYEHHSGDRSHVTDLLNLMAGSDEERQAYFRLIEARAWNFVWDPRMWTAIEAVAAALLERKVLTGKATRAVILRSIAPPSSLAKRTLAKRMNARCI